MCNYYIFVGFKYWCRLHEDGGVPPKHIAANNNCIVTYIKCIYVAFEKEQFRLSKFVYDKRYPKFINNLSDIRYKCIAVGPRN
jgi:hypothetical protein